LGALHLQELNSRQLQAFVTTLAVTGIIGKTIDAQQIGQIINRAKEPFATMFAVLGMTGLRAGEMLGLKVGDLDFSRKLIHIRRSVDSRTRKEQSIKFGAGDGNRKAPYTHKSHGPKALPTLQSQRLPNDAASNSARPSCVHPFQS
jgi:integrase